MSLRNKVLSLLLLPLPLLAIVVIAGILPLREQLGEAQTSVLVAQRLAQLEQVAEALRLERGGAIDGDGSMDDAAARADQYALELIAATGDNAGAGSFDSELVVYAETLRLLELLRLDLPEDGQLQGSMRVYQDLLDDAAGLFNRAAIATADAELSRLIWARAATIRLQDAHAAQTLQIAQAIDTGVVNRALTRQLSVSAARGREQLLLLSGLGGAAGEAGVLETQLTQLGRRTVVASALEHAALQDVIGDLVAASGYDAMIHHFKNLVIRGGAVELQRVGDSFAELDALFERARSSSRLLASQRAALRQLQGVFDRYRASVDRIVELRAAGRSPSQIDAQVRIDDAPARVALEQLRSWQPPQDMAVWRSNSAAIDSSLQVLSADLRMQMNVEAQRQLAAVKQRFWLLLAMTLLIVMLMLTVAAQAYRRLTSGLNAFMDDLHAVVSSGDLQRDFRVAGSDEITKLQTLVVQYNQRVLEMAQLAEEYSQGDVRRRLAPLGNDDQLAIALRGLAESAAEVTESAQQIAGGNYQAGLRARGEHDSLAVALTEMGKSLAAYRANVERSKSVSNGQLAVLRALRNPKNMNHLATAVLGALCKTLDLRVGAMYVLAGEQLQLAGHLGLPERVELAPRLDPERGQLSSAVREMGTQVLDRLPADYLPAETALGKAAAVAVSITGLHAGERPVAVIELAWPQPPQDFQVELLDTVAESIAIAVSALSARNRTEELLVETQGQARRLEEQQEELRTANEELEEQTQALRQSEEELKMQREELQTSNEELEEKSESLEAQKAKLKAAAEGLKKATKYKSEFLANMSHELRTPLNSMLILTKQLADNDEGNLTADQVEAAQVVNESGRDLLELINEILDLSKVEAGQLSLHLEPVELDSLLDGLRRQFQPQADAKQVTLRLECKDGTPQAMVTDRQRLQQVLRNLLSNAIKFTAKGEVSLEVSAEQDLLHFAVRDSGIGIDPGKIEEIFQPFIQADGSTSRQYGGTGLGLSICRELSKLLGGQVSATSEPGVGSCFTVILPCKLARRAEDRAALRVGDQTDEQAEATAAEPRAALAQPQATVPPAAGRTADGGEPAAPQVEDDRASLDGTGQGILIIEDDARFAKLVRNQVRSYGLKALVALDGASGLQLANQFLPRGIILDLRLPDIDGAAVLNALKHSLATRHIPVHVVSASDSQTDTLRLGALGFLPKPASAEDLNGVLQGIDRVHNERRRVLAVEDDAGTQKAIRALLENEQTSIETEPLGERALQRLQTEKFDCVVLDLKLPDIDGFEFLRRLHARGGEQHPPVVVYTGRVLSREEHRELSALAQSVVVKGAESPERLLDEVTLFLHALKEQLPAAQQQMLERLHDSAELFKGKKMLIVDDDLRNTFALSSSLKKQGFEISIADNGQMALDKLEEMPDTDIVLMDIMMPVMDGFEAMRRIRADGRFDQLPVLALTAKAMPEDRRQCIEAGASDYMTKPIDMQRLLAMIRLWLGRAR